MKANREIAVLSSILLVLIAVILVLSFSLTQKLGDAEDRWQDWVTCRTMLLNPAPCDELFSPPNADNVFHTVDEQTANLIQELADAQP